MPRPSFAPAHSEWLGLRARYDRFIALRGASAARRQAYRRTLAELQACSDRDLADLGFHRSELPRIAREAAGLD